MMEDHAWHEEILQNPHIRTDAVSGEEWQEIQRLLIIGNEFPASIVGRAPFGLWVDVGVGRAALLRIIDTNRPTKAAGEDCRAYCRGEWGLLGTEIRVKVVDVAPERGDIIVEGVAGSWPAK